MTTSMVDFGARRFTHQRYRVPLPGDAVIVRKSFSLISLYNGVHIAYCTLTEGRSEVWDQSRQNPSRS